MGAYTTYPLTLSVPPGSPPGQTIHVRFVLGPTILDLGCGPNRDPEATDGMDLHPYAGANIVHDATKLPWPIAAASFDRLVSHQLIEHLPVGGGAEGGADPFFAFFDEAWRVLRPGGTFAFDVPHHLGPEAYGDPTHRRFYSERSFAHLWDPARDPLYPRRPWTLVRVRTDYWYAFPRAVGADGRARSGIVNASHLKRRAPALDRVAQRLGLGVPHYIYVELRKPAGEGGA